MDANGVREGFVYQNGSYTTLEIPTTGNIWITGVNNAGQIVGYDYGTGQSLHIGNFAGDSNGCIVVGSSGLDNGFWNDILAFMGKILPASSFTTTANGQTFYPLPIPIKITVQNSPAQPNLIIDTPVTQFNTSSVKLEITNLASQSPLGANPTTNNLIDKDITSPLCCEPVYPNHYFRLGRRSNALARHNLPASATASRFAISACAGEFVRNNP